MNEVQTTGDRRTDAYCGAWIYTKEDCFLNDENGDQEYVSKDPELTERILNDIGNNDYIYQVIQESVDERNNLHFMKNSTRTDNV